MTDPDTALVRSLRELAEAMQARLSIGQADIGNVERAADRLEAHQQELAEARFAPLGDNHHNAAACPHCSAGWHQVADKLDTLGRYINHGTRIGHEDATMLHQAATALRGKQPPPAHANPVRITPPADRHQEP